MPQPLDKNPGLLEKGQVKVQNFHRSDRKMAYSYLLTPKGVADKVRLTKVFLARKESESEALTNKIKSLQVEVAANSKLPRTHKRAR